LQRRLIEIRTFSPRSGSIYHVHALATLHCAVGRFPQPRWGRRRRASGSLCLLSFAFCAWGGLASRGAASKLLTTYSARRRRRSRFRSRDAIASEAWGTKGKVRLQISEGRRSADRRIVQPSAPHIRVLPLEYASGALASRRSAAVLAAQINATAQLRPRFTRNTMRRRYLRLESRLQRCTSRAGHSAGRFDAQAARERGYEARPQEPHPLRQSAVTGDVPSMSGITRSQSSAGAKSNDL
jgi:hypothetical protein